METEINQEVEEDEDSQNESLDGEFYFESDHLALRGDPDYILMLRTIAILQAQRIQATKDIDRIAEAKKEALENPEQFIKDLSQGNDLKIPGPINIIELPKINFKKYNVEVPDFPKESLENTKANDITVRGRVFDQSKPETFNQLWTNEEQRRLEELLIEYPPEPIEMRRFAKIARALGNRTTKQVASRVQKFFKKLYSAGMPIPGRIPKNLGDYRSYKNYRNSMKKTFFRNTTFFPAQDVPVVMPEDDDFSGGTPLDFNFYNKGTSTNSITVDQESDEEHAPNESDDLKRLKLIQRIRNDKERFTKNCNKQSEHDGYKCDFCTEEPIFGTRWHCVTCSQASIDYCSDCLVTQLIDSKKCHSLDHRFIGIRVTNQNDTILKQVSEPDSDTDNEPTNKNSVYDKDYLSEKFNQEDYNYLDMNFLPE